MLDAMLARRELPIPIRSFSSAKLPLKEKYKRVDRHCLFLSFTGKSKNGRRKLEEENWKIILYTYMYLNLLVLGEKITLSHEIGTNCSL
jgi:hypothetical protein